MYAKQGTAKTFLVGPVLDADGVAKTDEVVASIKVTKNGTVGAADASSTLTHDHTGKYKYAAVDGDDFDTLGEVVFSLNSGTNAMAPVRFQVLPANVYDSLVSGSDLLDVNASQLGAGADTVTLTLKDEDTGLAVADADVWVTSDIAGTDVVAGTVQTDSAGETTLYLDAGVTYYRWAQKDGKNFENPQSFVASAD